MSHARKLRDTHIAFPTRVPAAHLRLWRRRKAVGNQGDRIYSERRKFLQHLHSAVTAIKRREFRGEIHSALKKDLGIGRARRWVRQLQQIGAMVALPFPRDGTVRVKRSSQKQRGKKQSNPENAQPSHQCSGILQWDRKRRKGSFQKQASAANRDGLNTPAVFFGMLEGALHLLVKNLEEA